MFKLKEIICHPPPPPHIRFKYCPLHSLRLLCRLCGFCHCHRCQRFISLFCCPHPLFISVTDAMSVAFADANVVAVALSSSAPLPIAIFAIIVCYSYLLTFPRLFTFKCLGCYKLEPDPFAWWFYTCCAALTSWYHWRHQPWSIPQPPGEPG